MYPLFETIRILNGKAENLPWHQARMDYSYESLFMKKNMRFLEDLVQVPKEFSKGLVKCRFMYNRSGHALEFSDYIPRKVQSLKLVNGDQLEYSLKYSDRNAILKLLEEKGKCDDILIVRNGMISDTSYANIVFYDGKNWVTPKIPLLEGTCRNRLLEENKIMVEDIGPEDLGRFKYFRLINAMLGFDEQENVSIPSIDF